MASRLSQDNKELDKIFDKEIKKLRVESGPSSPEMFQKISPGVYILGGRLVVSMSMEGDTIRASFAKDGKVISNTLDSLL